MQVKHRWWAAVAAVTVLGTTTGCGHDLAPQADSAPAAAGSSATPATASNHGTGSASPGTSSPDNGASGAGRSVATHRGRTRPQAASTAGAPLPRGSYDDTSGTTAKKPSSQKKVLDTLPGKSTGGCVDVGSLSAVRSGSVAMGDFADARARFLKTKGAYDADPSFFYVIPESRDAKRVKVVLTPETGHADAIRVVSDQVEDAAQWKYFPISVKIPTPGTWRFSVTVGAEHGCFDADFRA